MYEVAASSHEAPIEDDTAQSADDITECDGIKSLSLGEPLEDEDTSDRGPPNIDDLNLHDIVTVEPITLDRNVQPFVFRDVKNLCARISEAPAAVRAALPTPADITSEDSMFRNVSDFENAHSMVAKLLRMFYNLPREVNVLDVVGGKISWFDAEDHLQEAHFWRVEEDGETYFIFS